jgi:hypothetical protein
MRNTVQIGLLVLVASTGGHLHAADRVIVHEWGTFTCLQDEDGNSIGGINTDDEPVPPFVHRLAYNLLLSPTEAPPHFFQGAPSCHPDVTMRLETPVMYFYPPKGVSLPPFNVHVSFRGGWLTEYYPDAVSTAPGLDTTAANKSRAATSDTQTGFHFPHLKKDSVGELTWTGLTLGGNTAFPDTKEKVWLTPRSVQSTQVETPAHESEKYLFYRGVSNDDACLRVTRNNTQHRLSVSGNWEKQVSADTLDKLTIPAAWLLDIRPNGTCAFKALGAVEYQRTGAAGAVMPDSFAAEDFSQENMPLLRREMQRELVKAGLFKDEADALLNTWQASYFQSPGLRLFYLCPQAITNHLLPLSISMPCNVTRVMIGRIEIVTPEQRALLQKLAKGPAPDLSHMRGKTADSNSDFFNHPENVALWKDVCDGKRSIRLLGLDIPELYLDYLRLGRFRNALILDEQKRRPTVALKEFITQNGFEAYYIQDTATPK